MAKLKTISLFTGIGGLDFGFEAAGYDTRLALEFDRYCCRSIWLNRPWEVIEDDINKVASATVLERAGLRPEADMLIWRTALPALFQIFLLGTRACAATSTIRAQIR